MKTNRQTVLLLLLMVFLLSVAQNRVGALKAPSAPTPIELKERTIQDLLYYPFSCIETNMTTQELARQTVENTFGTCETINGFPGLHANGSFDFSYRGRTIGNCSYDWIEDRTWYDFYFAERSEAEQFYNSMVKDVMGAGIPLAKDNIYGGLSNRKRPVSIFKWVFVVPPAKVKASDSSNIDTPDVVGMYKVELGVYKKKRK